MKGHYSVIKLIIAVSDRFRQPPNVVDSLIVLPVCLSAVALIERGSSQESQKIKFLGRCQMGLESGALKFLRVI